MLHAAETIIPPPRRLPDIYPVLNVLISTPVFAFTWLWSIKRGVEIGWAAGGLGASRSKPLAEARGANGDRAMSAVEPSSSSFTFPPANVRAEYRAKSMGHLQGRKTASALKD